MPSRLLSTVLFAALVAASVWAQSSSGSGSGGAVPETMSGYHPSGGYGGNGWTMNTSSDTSQHSQAPAKSGGSSATYASRDEIQLIQQKMASRRAQHAHPEARPSQPAPPAASPQQP